MAQIQVFTCEYCEFFKNSIFYRISLVAAFNKERGKNFQMKEENENISFKFYLQLLNIRTAHPFSLTLSSNFLSFDSCMFVFCVFISYKLKNIFLHLLVYSEAGIESCSVKQLFGKIEPKLSIFFYKTGVSFQYSLLNKKVYKYIKSEILCRYSSRVMVIKSILQCNWATTFFHGCEWLPLIIYFIKCN